MSVPPFLLVGDALGEDDGGNTTGERLAEVNAYIDVVGMRCSVGRR